MFSNIKTKILQIANIFPFDKKYEARVLITLFDSFTDICSRVGCTVLVAPVQATMVPVYHDTFVKLVVWLGLPLPSIVEVRVEVWTSRVPSV